VEGKLPRLTAEASARYLEQLATGWSIGDDRLRRTFEFKDFVQAMAFVNRMADVAEREQHHPDFAVHWNRVEVSIWTHVSGGVTDNDFILAAKIDAL
jgi:4a-hydroxytetrahydrobiopterin dehydratase